MSKKKLTAADAIARASRDGQMGVARQPDGDTITILVHDFEDEQVLRMSEWQARRVLGALSVLLELPLSKAAQKEIKF